MKVPAAELAARWKKFTGLMDAEDESWRYVFLFDPVSCYYFTGTFQNGVLVISRQEEPSYYVQSGMETAAEESRFSRLISATGYADMVSRLSPNPYSRAYVDKTAVPAAVLEEFNEYAGFSSFRSCDRVLARCRAKKSVFEINLLSRAGEIARETLEEYVPAILAPGITEAEVGAALTAELIKRGHHGVARSAVYGREVFTGRVAFGANALKKRSGGWTGGLSGLCPAAPVLGSHSRILEPEDLIHVDAYCGAEGYHVALGCVYAFNGVSDYVYAQHRRCREIRDEIASELVPGATPSRIYEKVMATVHPALEGILMGAGREMPEFLGRGIGLFIDDYPKIACGFSEPIEENTAFVIEPRAALERLGLPGVTSTYVAGPSGGESVTRDKGDIIILS